jgi:voltage-gated potassium channel
MMSMSDADEIVPWDQLQPARRRRLLAGQALRLMATLGALFTVYFLAPVGARSDTSVSTIGVLILGAIVFVVTLSRQIRVLGTSSYPVLRAVQSIVTMVGLFVVAFALGYLVLSNADPDAFSESLNKVDALYFTVTVFATVGFGDITATSSGARLLVTAQMLLGLGLIGAVVRYVAGLARSIAGRRGSTPD